MCTPRHERLLTFLVASLTAPPRARNVAGRAGVEVGAMSRVFGSIGRIVSLLVLVTAAGFVSNVVSRPWCERALMQEALQNMGGGHPLAMPVYVLPDDGPRSERALHRLGVATVRCTNDLSGATPFDCFPWASVSSRIVIPFVVIVRWEYVAFPTSGHGTETAFVCLFGLRVRLRDRGLWVS
jgi:hypothetical protein